MTEPFNNQRIETERKSLLRILSRCRELVSESEDIGWSCSEAPEILKSLDQGLAAINADTKPDVDELKVLFAPTGPLQETSIGNDWADEFLTLATAFDKLITNL